MSEAQSQGQRPSSLMGLTLGAIGVVYGDIGTSVLYSIKEVFGSGHVAFTPDNVYGILSIFFWTLTVIVSLKYVTLVLRADNNGASSLPNHFRTLSGAPGLAQGSAWLTEICPPLAKLVSAAGVA